MRTNLFIFLRCNAVEFTLVDMCKLDKFWLNDPSPIELCGINGISFVATYVGILLFLTIRIIGAPGATNFFLKKVFINYF